jgi:hypothetical protein
MVKRGRTAAVAYCERHERGTLHAGGAACGLLNQVGCGVGIGAMGLGLH